MNRIIVNKCPSSIVRLIGDEYVYNYDIQKIDDERYSYISVSQRGYPNYKDCVIRQYYTQDEEFDLINTYNYNILNNEDDSEYINYLNLLKEIKTKIKADFE